METKELTKADMLALLAGRLRAGLGKDLVQLLVLREDPAEPETMRFPITLVAVLHNRRRADEVTDIVVDVNLETDCAYPAFAYAVSEAEYERGSSLKAQVMRQGVTL